MKITVDFTGLEVMKAKLRGLQDKKIKVAMVAALNDAAYAGAQATRKEMASVFDRPTPWVLGSVRYVKARQDKLEAKIDFDQWGNKTNVTVEKVLMAEIMGGVRRFKRHELALKQVGILPEGMAIVPGPAAIKDQYGNMMGSQIVQIVAWFKGFERVAGARQNMTDKTRARLGKDKKNGTRGFAYFVLPKQHGKLPPGIYQRFTLAHGSAIKPIMYFVRIPSYQRRLDFYGIAERESKAAFNAAFPRYLAQLLKEQGL